MTPTFLVRHMIETDLEDIALLEAGCSGGWTKSQMTAALHQPGAWQLVCQNTIDDAIVGYLFGTTVLDEAEIYRLAVSPPFRRKGFGRRLLERAIDRLHHQGVKSLFLEVRESNQIALSLYRAAGFSPFGRRKKYYSAPSEDAVMMRRTIPVSRHNGRIT